MIWGVLLTIYLIVRVHVLTEAIMKMMAFWDIALCGLFEVNRRFRGAYCLHHQGDDGGVCTYEMSVYLSEATRFYITEGYHLNIYLIIYLNITVFWDMVPCRPSDGSSSHL
jgi:hypothetical protein